MNENNIPKQVWVLGHPIALVGKRMWPAGSGYEDKDRDKYMFAEGMMCWKSQEISFQSEHTESWTRELVLHEVLHALDDALSDQDADEDIDKGFGKARVEERGGKKVIALTEGHIKRRSRALFSVLTDPRNQQFVRWLVGDKQLAIGSVP